MIGKLNPSKILVEYKGKNTATARTTVDNTNYEIKVDVIPQALPTLDVLANVNIVNPQNDEALVFDTLSSTWKNKTIVTDISGKLDKNLGSINQGKFLKVDTDGAILPIDLVLTTTLAELNDVNLLYTSEGNILIYDHVLGKWKNSDKLSILEARVEGSTIAYVFDNYAQLVSWIDGEYSRIDGVLPTDLTLNNNIYLKELSENDYWVSSLPVISIDNLSILETNKVDLSDYFTKNQVELLLSSYELLANKTATIDENSTDTQYPTAKAVYTALQTVGIIMELGDEI